MRKRKHIAFIANTSWYIYNLRYGVIKALQKRGVKVTVIAPRDSYTEKLLAKGCHFIPIKIDNKGINPFKDFILYLKLRKLFKANPFDYVFNYTVKPNIFASIAANGSNLKTISIVSGRGYSYVRKDWLSNLINHLYKFAFKFNYQVWFVNQDDLNFFIDQKILPTSKCQLLPGEGINLRFFKPQKNNINSEEKITFLFSGRLIWSKGVGSYINAARFIQKKYPDTQFKLLGYFGVENPDAISIAQIMEWQKEGVITYEGFTEDVRPFLAKSDCFVLPSYYGEGTPKSLLEAASMETPIITSDSVGCREVVNHGENGFLCQPKDERDLIDKIEQFLTLSKTERTEMGQRGRNIVEKSFDEKLIIPFYNDLIFPIQNKKTEKVKETSTAFQKNISTQSI